MRNITIIEKEHWPGEYFFRLSNHHTIRISEFPELDEWHIWAEDETGKTYEPLHPFYETFREAKSHLDYAIQKIQNMENKNEI